MSSEVLYRKWRPQTLGEVVGQETVTTTLRNAVRSNRVGHAYLFCGPRGTGKTSTGRILAKAVNCLSPADGEPCNECDACVSISEGRCLDVIESDAASNRGVDDIRQLRERVNYAAGMVRRKVYIVDEVHMLTDVASNALLKTLEEPPPHVVFILATTEFHRVLPTIVSRCQCFHFRRLALNSIAAKLRLVCEQEGIEIEDTSLAAIARAAAGSLRDAENLLQQLLASHGRQLLAADVREGLGIADESHVIELLRALTSRDLTGGLRVLHQASDDGLDMRHFSREVVMSLRDVLLVKSGCDDIVEGGVERIEELRQIAQEADLGDISRAMRLFGDSNTKDASHPLLALEIAFVDGVAGTTQVEAAGEKSDGPAVQKSVRKRTPPSSARVVPGDRGAQPIRSGETEGRSVHEEEPPPVVSRAASTGGGRPVETGEAELHSPELVGGAEPEEQLQQTPAAGMMDVPARSPVDGHSPQGEELEHMSGELGRVRASWREYVDSLRGLGSSGNLDAFLRSACEPVSLEDGVLVLRFSHQFHKNKVEDPKYRHVVEERLHQFYGRPYRIACVLEVQSGGQSNPSTDVRAEGHLVEAALKLGARPRSPK